MLVIPKRVLENLKPQHYFLVRLTTIKSLRRFLGVSKVLVCADEKFVEKSLLRFQRFWGYYDKKVSGVFAKIIMDGLAI
jgi:hypothetical protein